MKLTFMYVWHTGSGRWVNEQKKERQGTNLYLLYINPTSPHVCGDQDSSGSRPELRHDGISFFLWHVSMHGGNREVTWTHFLCQPLNLCQGKKISHHYGHTGLTWHTLLMAFTSPFFLCYRKWQLGWWSMCRTSHKVCRTSTLLFQQPQKIVWFPTNEKRQKGWRQSKKVVKEPKRTFC